VVSNDSLATFTDTTSFALDFSRIRMSQNGQYQLISNYNNYLILSNNYGSSFANITSLGNLPYLQVSNSANVDGVIRQIGSNNISFATNATNIATYELATIYHPNASTAYPGDRVVRSRGNVTNPTTGVSGDRVYQKASYVYNGNTNVVTALETVAVAGTVNANANAAYTGGQWTLNTGNPQGDTGNILSITGQNALLFNNAGGLSITPGTPANSSLGQTQSPLLITNYGASTTDLVGAGGITQQRARGNRDSVVSVQPGDFVGQMIYSAHNGTSYDGTNASRMSAVVDSSYVANQTVIPQNLQFRAVANVGGVATIRITSFNGNGLAQFPGDISTPGNVNIGSANAVIYANG
jgi:hypothetical protein